MSNKWFLVFGFLLLVFGFWSSESRAEEDFKCINAFSFSEFNEKGELAVKLRQLIPQGSSKSLVDKIFVECGGLKALGPVQKGSQKYAYKEKLSIKDFFLLTNPRRHLVQFNENFEVEEIKITGGTNIYDTVFDKYEQKYQKEN